MFEALKYFDALKFDVLCLQELNSSRVGPIGFIFYTLFTSMFMARFFDWIKRIFPSLLALTGITLDGIIELTEYLAVGEGLLLPIFLVDNSTDVIKFAQQNTRFKYSTTSPVPHYFLNSGLVILSVHPIDESTIQHTYLPRDTCNVPGMLTCQISINKSINVRIFNLHFVPSLLDTKLVFRCLNILNDKVGRNPDRLRETQYPILIKQVQQSLSNASKTEPYVFVVGDLNVSHGSSEQQHFDVVLRKEAGLIKAMMKPQLASSCEMAFHHEGWIDYIFYHTKLVDAYRTRTGGAVSKKGDSVESKSQVVSSIKDEDRRGLFEWPVHDLNANEPALFSTRVNSMLSSDHYPQLFECEL